jgi:hypothetical protein
MVAAVNGWIKDAAKLWWLQVRLTGRAATAYKCFQQATKGSYTQALRNRFEPDTASSRRKVTWWKSKHDENRRRKTGLLLGRMFESWQRRYIQDSSRKPRRPWLSITTLPSAYKYIIWPRGETFLIHVNECAEFGSCL